MRVGFHSAVALGLLICTGCVREKVGSSASAPASAYGEAQTRRPEAGSQPIVTPEHRWEGMVASVNANLRFVVITFPVGQVPAIDQRLNVYRQGLKVGEVKITGPLRDDCIVADLVAGEAGPGDTIRDR